LVVSSALQPQECPPDQAVGSLSHRVWEQRAAAGRDPRVWDFPEIIFKTQLDAPYTQPPIPQAPSSPPTTTPAKIPDKEVLGRSAFTWSVEVVRKMEHCEFWHFLTSEVHSDVERVGGSISTTTQEAFPRVRACCLHSNLLFPRNEDKKTRDSNCIEKVREEAHGGAQTPGLTGRIKEQGLIGRSREGGKEGGREGEGRTVIGSHEGE